MTVCNAVAICNGFAVDLRSLALALGWLLIRLDIELDEQPQVARQEYTAKDRGRFRAGARSQTRKALKVVGGIVRISL